MENVRIFDTTLRDGEQAPGAAMTPPARLRIAERLAAAGVDIIEAGFPIASPLISRSTEAIAKRVRTAQIAALARCFDPDIDAAWEAIRKAAAPRIHVFIATSDIHLRHKLRTTRDAAYDRAVDAVRRAKRYCSDVEFSAEDATRSDRAYLARICSGAIAAGATTVNIPDTVGYTTPGEYASLIAFLREQVPGAENAVWSVHTHNDLGLATANALAAVEAGARQVECTINGIGERAGNCALEEVVMAMRTRADYYPFTTRFETRTLTALSSEVARAAAMPVQKNKAIVGRNAFSHQSGIHQDGVLKERTTYEIMDPASVGVSTDLPLGRLSGRHALFERAAQLGYRFDDGQRAEFERRFAKFAQRRRTVEDAELDAIARAVTLEVRVASVAV